MTVPEEPRTDARIMREALDVLGGFTALMVEGDYEYDALQGALAAHARLVEAAEQARRENVRLTGILARLRPDIDPATGYGKREGI